MFPDKQGPLTCFRTSRVLWHVSRQAGWSMQHIEETYLRSAIFHRERMGP